MQRYFIIYKPYLVISQFTAPETQQHTTLKDVFDVPRDVYPVGRLDSDSEGLLLLTDDASLNHRLLHPSFRHRRTYLAQVEGIVSKESLTRLADGVQISVNGKAYQTKHCEASLPGTVPNVPDRDPPIRVRKEIPDTWIQLVLTEGKNRQVRKMTAAAGHPTLRLIRTAIEDLSLDSLQPGDLRELSQKIVYQKLFHE